MQRHSPERKNDYWVYKMKYPILAKDLMNFFDLGYMGVEKDFPKQISIIPYKKRKGPHGFPETGTRLRPRLESK